MARRWALVGSPLRPHVSDVAIFADELSSERETLLLGVTSEIGQMPLRGIAVDINPSMIEHIWPHPKNWQVMLGDWKALPLQAQSVDQIIGDASFSASRFPQDVLAILGEMERVLRKDGKALMRVFVQPEEADSRDLIQKQAWAGEIKSFNVLKWRVAMLHGHELGEVNAPAPGVLQLFNALFPERLALCEHCGWAAEVLETVDVYADSAMSFSFPTLPQLLKLISGYSKSVRVRYGNYELNERCPILIMEQFA